MAKIINNLNDSLDNRYSPKTHTHTGVVTSADYTDGTSISIDGADYSTQIGTLNSLQTSNKNNLVAAINELFQNANSGKQLIANAIGEPLSSNDTFSAMSSDINNLLSTFKTNMMNAGVAIESSDKFKALIDKIKGLTEGEGNKGIQFTSGDISITATIEPEATGSRTLEKSFNNIIEFQPSIIFIKVPHFTEYSTGTYGSKVHISYNNYILTSDFQFIGDNSLNRITVESSERGFKLKLSAKTINESGISINTNCTYYAIGVGEEDTTLRDSLADILENKGVDVTEEDDMASLISKVDNISGGLDIISTTTLPATGKENQVCVVTDNVTDIFLITSKIEDITTDASKINIYIGTEDTSDSTLLSITNNNITTNYYFNKVCQGNNRLASYYYQNNTWNQLTRKNVPVYQNSSFPSASILGDSPIRTSSSTAYLDGKSIFIGTSSSSCRGFTFSKAIDFSGYKKVTVVAYDKYGTSTLYVVAMLKHYTAIVNLGTNTPGSSYTSYRKSITVGAESPTVYTFDISSWSGTYYFGILANGNSSWLYINEIILE